MINKIRTTNLVEDKKRLSLLLKCCFLNQSEKLLIETKVICIRVICKPLG